MLAGDGGKFGAFGKASQLPGILEGEKQGLEEERKQLKRDKAAREKQFWQYYQVYIYTKCIY